METYRSALVTGASGALGSILVESLLRDGKRVRALTRCPIECDRFSSPVESAVGDITDPNTVTRAAAGVDVVFHLAALLHVSNPPPSLRAEYERVNVKGTRLLVESAQKAGVRRFVFFSTIAVHGPTMGEIADETTPPQPDTFYAETKFRGEEIALSARRDSGEPLACVLRLAAAYGANMTGNYRQLALALARGWFLPIGDGLNRRTVIHERDAVAAALLAAQHPQAAGDIFNVTDGRFHELREIMAAMSLALGRTPPRFSLPVTPVRWVAGQLEDAARLVGRQSPIVRATIDKYTEDVAVSGDKIRRLLGFSPQYDLLSGWHETVQELRRTGVL